MLSKRFKAQEELAIKIAKAKEEIIDTIKIRYVDGEEVRKKEIDFCLAGNGFRFPGLIPQDEIWVEKVYKDDKLDLVSDLCHECVERLTMKFLGLTYDTAHDLANVAEKAVRKHKMSKRAAMEQSSSGINISTTARLKWREYYSKHGMPNMALMNNKLLNETMGADAKSAKVLHRFHLKDKSIGEFRLSHAFYYLLKYVGGNYVIITIQPSYKEATPEISKQRLTPEWLGKK
jgi:hypothetical protein